MSFLTDPIVCHHLFPAAPESSYDKFTFPELMELLVSETLFSKRYVPALHFNKQSDTAVLYFHGNGEDLGNTYEYLQHMSEYLNHSVFCPEYFGYGPSKQYKPSERNCYEVADAAIDYLLPKYKNIIIFGRSIGTGLACYLASTIEKPMALILHSPYKNIKSLVTELVGWPALFVRRRMFDNLARIQNIRCPLLIIHGQLDTLINPGHAKQLHRVSPSLNKKLAILPHSDHNYFQSTDVLYQVEQFLINID